MRLSIPWLVSIAALLGTAHAATIPDYPFVYVTGEAHTRVPPDVADVTFTVLAEGRNAASADHTVESRVVEILGVLHAGGVSDDRIDASSLTKEAVTTDYSEGKPAIIRGYKVSRQFEAKISDLKKWPEIATRLLDLQNITDVQVTFGRSDAKAIDAALLEKAAKDARERAQRLAISFGRHAGVLMALSQSPFGSLGPSFGVGSGDGAAAAPLEEVVATGVHRDAALFIPHSIELTAEVHALVKLQ